MKRSELFFNRPPDLAATSPAEARGETRDMGRLLVSTPTIQKHASFLDLPSFLQPGDLLVVNRSATMPASLPAAGLPGAFILNLSTHYGSGLWLVEPRHSPSRPGPLPIELCSEIRVAAAGITGRFVAPYPGLPRLWYIQFSGDVQRAMRLVGRPIRYGYLDKSYDLKHYQTIFANQPGSAEMPSAAYPFTGRVLRLLQSRGVQLASIVLHTGISSLEVEVETVEQHPLYPEPYWVPTSTINAIKRAKAAGSRVIALGTTVVRALESAWGGRELHSSAGFTRLYIHPARGVQVVDGLITGLHDPSTSHLAMLYAVGGKALIRSAYREAVHNNYQWHEFGDSHLILPRVDSQRKVNDQIGTYAKKLHAAHNPYLTV